MTRTIGGGTVEDGRERWERLWVRVVIVAFLAFLALVIHENRKMAYYDYILDHVHGSMSAEAVEAVETACAVKYGPP